MGGINASKDANQQVQKQIRILENRLDKALVKFNEVRLVCVCVCVCVCIVCVCVCMYVCVCIVCVYIPARVASPFVCMYSVFVSVYSG